jgi:BolA protein
MGEVAETIRSKLTAAFDPERLDVIDDSAKHHGHSGAREGGESHFTVDLVAAAFAHKNRVERQRMVHDVLRDELAGPVHALSIVALAPGEGA